METYKIPIRLGIDDINYYPTAQESEWWTEEQWEKFHAESPVRKERDRLYVEQLRMEGRYGKVEHLTITMMHNPVFDNVKPMLEKAQALSSCKIIFLEV